MNTIERKLFSWDGWDQHSTACYEFYNCILLRQIKQFEAGTKFDSIVIDYENSKIEFSYADEGFSFDISLTIE